MIRRQGLVKWKEPNMKRIGRYLITAVGLMSVGAPGMFARDRFDRREVRRHERFDRRYWR